jgi:aspartate racemase
MKTLGIIGGIGPESTIEYYRSLVSLYQEEKKDGSSPSLIVNSIDLKRILDLAASKKTKELAEYLVCEASKLVSAGADLVLIAANTPHLVFHDVSHKIPVPMISIVEATSDVAKAAGLKNLALFGTRFTMRGGFYQRQFARERIGLTLPELFEQDYIHDAYVNELVKGAVHSETHDTMLTIISRMKRENAVDGLILGGTELSLIFRESSVCDIPVLNTTQIHVSKAISWLVS